MARRLNVAEERLNRENALASRTEKAVLKRRDFKELVDRRHKEETEKLQSESVFERHVLAQRANKTALARARRMEAEEAVRIADTAEWKANMETRLRNAANDAARRREARARLARVERERIRAFVDVYMSAHDGKVDNRVLNAR